MMSLKNDRPIGQRIEEDDDINTGSIVSTKLLNARSDLWDCNPEYHSYRFQYQSFNASRDPPPKESLIDSEISKHLVRR